MDEENKPTILHPPPGLAVRVGLFFTVYVTAVFLGVRGEYLVIPIAVLAAIRLIRALGLGTYPYNRLMRQEQSRELLERSALLLPMWLLGSPEPREGDASVREVSQQALGHRDQSERDTGGG